MHAGVERGVVVGGADPNVPIAEQFLQIRLWVLCLEVTNALREVEAVSIDAWVDIVNIHPQMRGDVHGSRMSAEISNSVRSDNQHQSSSRAASFFAPLPGTLSTDVIRQARTPGFEGYSISQDAQSKIDTNRKFRCTVDPSSKGVRPRCPTFVAVPLPLVWLCLQVVWWFW